LGFRCGESEPRPTRDSSRDELKSFFGGSHHHAAELCALDAGAGPIEYKVKQKHGTTQVKVKQKKRGKWK
jgi:hypothetical protein